MAALAGGVACTACTAMHLALGAGLFGHGGSLVDAVKGPVLYPGELVNELQLHVEVGRTVEPTPWALVSPASMALSL